MIPHSAAFSAGTAFPHHLAAQTLKRPQVSEFRAATETLFIPATTRDAAQRVADAIVAGIVPCLPHYRDEAAARREATLIRACRLDCFAVSIPAVMRLAA